MRHLLFCIALLLPASAGAQSAPVQQGPKNVPEFQPAFPKQTRAPAQNSGVRLNAETFAAPLERPWGIAPLPDGGFLVTERTGRLRYINAAGRISAPLAGLPDIFVKGQGGLLDVALSPDFANDRLVYFTYAKPLGRGLSATAAARGQLSDDKTALIGVADIFVQSPPSPSAAHYGSRIVFDGAGRAFVTTGEHSSRNERVLAQDLSTTYGKVVRINPAGGAAAGNPFGDEIWSYGHRNIQGAAVHPQTGALWTVEHGPRGGDELNRPEAGKNYGWPVISYGENYNGSAIGRGITKAEGMEQPVYYWDPVIAPGGMIFYTGEMFPQWQGDILVASLRPGGLVRLRLRDGVIVGEERFLQGRRIRDVEQAADGSVLVLFDNPKGSVLRLTPQ